MRFVRVQYTDRKADPVSALLELSVQQLRDVPVILSTEIDFLETEEAGANIGQLTADDSDSEASTFDFAVIKAKNNRGETEDRISIDANGYITIRRNQSFDSIMCVDSYCSNCTVHDEWIDVTVTAEVLDHSGALPGPTILNPTKVRITVLLVNQAPNYNSPRSQITVKEIVEDIDVVDLSQFFCDREGTTMFFGMGTEASEFAQQLALSSSGVLQVSDAFDYETVQQVG